MFILLGSFSTDITIWDLDLSTKKISYLSSCSESGPSPSWLSVSHCQGQQHLFCTNEINNYEDQQSGAVSMFEINRSVDGLELSLINRVSSCGAWPCHLAIDAQDSTVYVANYYSGTFATLRMNTSIGTSPSLDSAQQIVSHCDRAPTGSAPHAHQVVTSSSDSIIVIDLGLDEVKQYKVDCQSGLLTPPLASFSSVKLPAGSGPRHIALHPTLPLAFVLCELSNEIVALQYDHSTGIVSSIPGSFAGECTSTLIDNNGQSFHNTKQMGAAGIVISPNGRFIYISNRDIAPEDQRRSSIVVFEIIDENCGKIKHLQTIYSGGRHPRHFALINDGNFQMLLVANKDSNNVVVFDVDSSSGIVDESSQVENLSPYIFEPSFVLCLT